MAIYKHVPSDSVFIPYAYEAFVENMHNLHLGQSTLLSTVMNKVNVRTYRWSQALMGLNTTGLWLASDHCHLGMASGHVASNDTEAINNFIQSFLCRICL